MDNKEFIYNTVMEHWVNSPDLDNKDIEDAELLALYDKPTDVENVDDIRCVAVIYKKTHNEAYLKIIRLSDKKIFNNNMITTLYDTIFSKMGISIIRCVCNHQDMGLIKALLKNYFKYDIEFDFTSRKYIWNLWLYKEIWEKVRIVYSRDFKQMKKLNKYNGYLLANLVKDEHCRKKLNQLKNEASKRSK